MSSLPTNWWIDPDDLAAKPQAEWTRITWMRHDPAPVPTQEPARPEPPALRVADWMVDLGERLALYLAGFSIGAALVVLVNHLFGGA